MPTEADTCRKFVIPKLQAAGWDNEPYSIAEQRTITDGRIVPVGKSFIRRPPKRVDYLLRYRRDFPLAVVEAKTEYKTAAQGLQQAKQYAEMLGLKFAYATNGPEIVEFDYFTGKQTNVANYPTPDALFQRFRRGKSLTNDTQVQQLLTPINFTLRQGERYYQEIAINRAVEAIVTGKRRILLTMATGTGKTPVAFQICWKLWNARWNRTGEHRRPKILYLSDRNILIDDPKDEIFAQFGDARAKIEYGHAIKSREVYFAILLRMGNIQNGRLDLRNLKYLHIADKDRAKFVLKRGDVLVNRTNSAELVGKCAVFDLERDFAFASYLIRLRLDTDKADPRLVASYINSPAGRAYMFSERKQMTGQANVNAIKLKALPIALPALPEQRRIVAELDALQTEVDALKRLQAETAAELDALLPSILDKAFKGEL
jgi:hypothetical protein